MWLFFVLLWIRLKLSISTYVNLPNSQYHIKTTVMDGNFNMWTMAVDKINAYCREKVWSWGTWWWQLIGLINSPCGKRSYNAIGPLALIVLSVQTIAPLYSNTELYVVYIVIYLREIVPYFPRGISGRHPSIFPAKNSILFRPLYLFGYAIRVPGWVFFQGWLFMSLSYHIY